MMQEPSLLDPTRKGQYDLTCLAPSSETTRSVDRNVLLPVNFGGWRSSSEK